MYNGRLWKRYVAGNIGSLENDEVSVSGSHPCNPGWS